MVRNFKTVIIFSCILLQNVQKVTLEEQCSIDSCGDAATKENKYSKAANNKYKIFTKNIEDAVGKYTPCVQGGCGCHLSTMNKDLEPFQSIRISKKMVDSIRSKGTNYQIISGKLYRQKNCLFPSRCSGIEHFIVQIVNKLPNMDLIINTRDWPQLNKEWGSPLAPVFSFSKTKDYWDIMYPAWSFWEGGPAIKLYPTGLGKWDQHRTSLSKAAEKWPWDLKKSVAFFRGSRTSEERDPIVLLSRSKPHLADAQYTKNQAWKSDADTLYAPPAEEVSLEDHCKYRYLFNYRGVAASFRFKHLFLCKSLVFHIGDEWLEFFYPSLKPWVHYIPVSSKATSEDIQDMIEFFKENDGLAREIVDRGHRHVWEHLRIVDVKCYWRKLLKSYAKLLDYKVVRNEDTCEIEIK